MWYKWIVFNDITYGPFIQTFKFIRYGFLFAFLHDKKDAQSMLEGFELLDTILGSELCSADLREPELLDQNDMNPVIPHVNSSPKKNSMVNHPLSFLNF